MVCCLLGLLYHRRLSDGEKFRQMPVWVREREKAFIPDKDIDEILMSRTVCIDDDHSE
mgnify:CR=1 FL=1